MSLAIVLKTLPLRIIFTVFIPCVCFSCLWFILEPLVKDGESHGLLYCILTSIKQSVDTRNPDNLEANKVILELIVSVIVMMNWC